MIVDRITHTVTEKSRLKKMIKTLEYMKKEATRLSLDRVSSNCDLWIDQLNSLKELLRCLGLLETDESISAYINMNEFIREIDSYKQAIEKKAANPNAEQAESAPDMVNHPSHYEKGIGHIECINLLEILVRGYSGIAAGCLMQAKYLYRAGSKIDALEDVKKWQFYLKHFYKLAKADALPGETKPDSMLSASFLNRSVKSIGEIETLQREFTFDKPEEWKPLIGKIVSTVANLESFSDVEVALDATDQLLNLMSATTK